MPKWKGGWDRERQEKKAALYVAKLGERVRGVHLIWRPRSPFATHRDKKKKFHICTC